MTYFWIKWETWETVVCVPKIVNHPTGYSSTLYLHILIETDDILSHKVIN